MNKYYVLCLSFVVLLLAIIRGMGITFASLFPFQGIILIGTIILIFLTCNVIVRRFKTAKTFITCYLIVLSAIGLLCGVSFGGYITILIQPIEKMTNFFPVMVQFSFIGAICFSCGLFICRYLHYASTDMLKCNRNN